MYMYVYSEKYSIKLIPCIERKPTLITGILNISIYNLRQSLKRSTVHIKNDI